MAEILISNKLSQTGAILFNKSTKTPKELIQYAIDNGIETSPLDVISLCKSFGIDIQYEYMDNDISGILEVRREGWIICVNAWQHKKRQRFTIAHELAHYFLHRYIHSKFITKPYHTRIDGNHDSNEKEADRFAAELLMPTDKFTDQIQKGNNKISSLSEYFMTSMLAVKIKAKELGY